MYNQYTTNPQKCNSIAKLKLYNKNKNVQLLYNAIYNVLKLYNGNKKLYIKD